MFGGRVQDAGGFGHLDHERALTLAEFVAGSNASEDSIRDSDAGFAGGNERTHLREQCDQCRLADVGALTRHVGARDDLHATVYGRPFSFRGFLVGAFVRRAFSAEQNIVRDELTGGLQLVEDRVATLANVENRLGGHLRTTVTARGRQYGQ